MTKTEKPSNADSEAELDISPNEAPQEKVREPDQLESVEFLPPEAQSTSEQDKISALEQLKTVRDQLSPQSIPTPGLSQNEIEAYIEKHVPEHLRSSPSLLYRGVQKALRFGVKKIEGSEKIPVEPSLFIANHRGGETGILIGALNTPVHIAAAETINWQRAPLRWVMKKLGMVPIQETFSHLSENEKQEVVERAPKSEKSAHERAVRNTGASNAKNVRAMVALLARGEKVAIFSEGPFSRIESDDRRSYAGYALVAREYKRVTGKDLQITPTGIRNHSVAVGDSFTIDQDGKDTKEDLENIATEKIHSLYDTL